MKKYFIHTEDGQTGPYSIEELKEKKITIDTHIWYEGLDNWKIASEIKELKSLFLQNPPPFKTAPEKSQESKSTSQVSTAKKKSKVGLYIGIGAAAICAILLISFLVQKNTEASIESALHKKEQQERVEKDKADSIALVRLKEQKLDSIKKEEERIEAEKFRIRNSFSDYISIDQSNYSADKFLGGITNLYYEVKNNTKYKIDVIRLEVKYFRSSGGLFKTEIVDIRNIKKNNSKRVKAPDSNLGVHVRKEIQNIYSKELSLCYEKGDFGNSSKDRYKCND